MKHNRYILGIIAVLTIAVGSWALPADAGGDRMYLSPSSKTVTINSSFSVGIWVYCPDGANAVQANLSYPVASMDVTGVSYAAAFSVPAQGTSGGGSIQIARGSFSVLTGYQEVAVVTFRAKVQSGSGTVGWAAGSAIANNGAEVPSSKAGGTYSFAAPAPKVAPAPTPVPPPAPPKDTTPPKITGLKYEDVTATSFVVAWQTDEPATSTVNYGLDNSYGLSATSTGLVTAHTVLVGSTFVSPLTSYHFQVKTADASGNLATSADQSLTTAGVPVQITVKDAHNLAVSGALVTYDNGSTRTNSSGVATFTTGAGPQIVSVTDAGSTTTHAINPSRSDAAKKPTPLVLTLAATSPWTLPWPVTLLLICTLLFGIAAFAYNWREWNSISKYVPTKVEPAVVALQPTVLPAPAAAAITAEPSVPVVTSEPPIVNPVAPAAETTPPPKEH